MPVKKKKAKPAKTVKKAKPAKKKAAKKPAPKKKAAKAKPKPKPKVAAKKPAAKPAKPAPRQKPAPAPKPEPVQQGPIKPAGAIGRVVHYYDKIMVAIVVLTGKLSVGDKIEFKRGERSFTQKIKSIQVQHKPLQNAGAGQVVGLKVDQIAPEGTWLIK